MYEFLKRAGCPTGSAAPGRDPSNPNTAGTVPLGRGRRPGPRSGFTLVELLVVIVIIGILTSVAIPRFSDARERAYFATLQSDLRSLALHQEVRHADSLNYAGSIGELEFVASSGVNVSITASTTTGWAATASHKGLASSQGCMTFSGAVASKPAIGSDTAANDGHITCVR